MKKIVSLLVAGLLFFSATTPAYAAIFRDETVYVQLNHDGSVKETEVVTRLSGEDSGSEFKTYGKYDTFTMLVDGVEPKKDQDTYIWSMEDLKKNDIYYSGTLKKELPLNLSIDYYFDGKKVSADEIAGKTGHFKLEIKVGKSDMAAQISLPLTLDHFSNVITDGLNTVVGKTMQIVFVHLPGSEGSYVVEGDTKEFTLNSIQIAGSYQSFKPGDDTMKEFDRFKDALNRINGSLGQLAGGSSQIAKALHDANDGVSQIGAGLFKANGGFATYLQSMKPLGEGMVQFAKGVAQAQEQAKGMLQLMQGLSQVQELSEQAEKISTALHELRLGYENLNQGHSQVAEGIAEIARNHEQILAGGAALNQNPESAPLYQALLQESAGLNALAQNASLLQGKDREALSALIQMDHGFSEISKALKALSAGIQQMASQNPNSREAVAQLQQLLNRSEQLKKGLLEFEAGGNQLFGGYISIENGLSELILGMSKLEAGQNQMTGGIYAVQHQGIKPMISGIDSTLGPLLEGPELKSFVDERNPLHSIAYIFQTPPIEKKKAEDTQSKEEKKENTLWERIVDLFQSENHL